MKVKPVFHTLSFEITLHVKKFLIFSVITILSLILNNYIVYVLRTSLPTSQAFFYEFGTIYFQIIVVFAVSFFFGGMICSEFKNKTGLEVLPLINRYKLIIGKYLANSILVIGIVAVHYLTMILLGFYFYGGPILNTLLHSFSFAVLYVLALGSIATFLSSFMPSITPVIIITSGLVILGFPIIDNLIMTISIEFEPLYSLMYLYNIIRYILYPDFSTMDRSSYGRWHFPSVEGALTALLLYAIIFFIFASILFKRREF